MERGCGFDRDLLGKTKRLLHYFLYTHMLDEVDLDDASFYELSMGWEMDRERLHPLGKDGLPHPF